MNWLKRKVGLLSNFNMRSTGNRGIQYNLQPITKIQKQITNPMLTLLAILLTLFLPPGTLSQSFTQTGSSVSPSYAKSPSSLYTFSFNASPTFTDNFDIRVTFPTQFTITTVSGCGFWLNGNAITGIACAVNTTTNQIVFTQLAIITAVSSIRLQFTTTTARYSGTYTLIFYYYSLTTSTITNSLTSYVQLVITNAIMSSCSITSTSQIVGDSITYTLSYVPVVPIEANSVLQIQMQPWGAYSQSNFNTTNVTAICNNTCTLSVPASNGNISELVRFTGLFPADTSAGGSVNLARARNPASTKQITISMAILAKISTFSQQQYMNCSQTFSVATPNTFRGTSFTSTSPNPAISSTNILTLRLTLTNPISSISYIRIQPSILPITYQFNNYNMGTQPFLQPTSDGSILLGGLTTSTTASPSIVNLNNFTVGNPPYGNKPVTLTFTTENLVDSVYYLVDKGTVDIVATPSTITQFGITIANTSINSITRYTIWLKTINRLISTSSILLTFPSQISLTPGTTTCTLLSFSSLCTPTNISSLFIDINTIINGGTNLSIVVNGVTNPGTTTMTDSIGVVSYYEDAGSVVDVLSGGFGVTASSVPVRAGFVTAGSGVVGRVSGYTVTVQIANRLPSGSQMRIRFPTSSFPTTIINLQSFSIGGTLIPGCTITTLSPLYIQLQPSCFPTPTPASTTLTTLLTNITNPTSTKPTQSLTLETLYNSLQMQYLLSGLTVTMSTPAPITSFTITPASQTVNAVTSYQFDLGFLFPHASGDRAVIGFPEDGVLLGAGFGCVAVGTGVSVACYQSSPTVLEVTFTLTAGVSISQLSFKVSSIQNNWYSSTRSLTLQTTTNDSTYYYVESGQYTLNFLPTSLSVVVASNEQIILLGQSTVRLTVTAPFAMARATSLGLLVLVVTVPGDLGPIGGTCTVGYSGASCVMTGQVLNITNFGDLSTPLTITFKSTTTYFLTSSPFQTTLTYSLSLIASDSTSKLSSYCTPPCKQCTSTPTQCLTCLPTPYTINNTYFADQSQCVAVCPVKYYALNGSCLACNQSACYGCSGGMNVCTSCYSGLFLYQGACLGVCPTGYYGVNGTCLQCVAPCRTCASAVVCLDCIANYFLDIDSKCVATCSNISYIGLNGTCQQCISNCLTCSQSLSNCTSCQATQYLLFNNTCVRACSSGYYNNVNSTCERCVSPCLTCSSRLSCESCVAGYYKFNVTTCTATCPAGTLAVVNTCQACNSACATCSVVLTNCTSCAPSLYFVSNQCLATCPNSTYPYQRTCVSCFSPCLTCSGTPDKCTTCIQGKFLQNSLCVDACSTDGYYTSGTICLPCTENCLTCQSLAQCNLCKSGFYLLSGGCVSQCPDSHPIISNRQCLGCSPECATCSGSPTNCTACTVFYFKYTYTCVKECPITFYSNTATYECEDGLTTKIVFFPILITSLVVIGVLLVVKCFARETSFVTAVAAFLGPLQLAIWCYVFSLMFAVFKETNITYTIPIVLLAFSIFSYILLAIVFFFVNKRKMEDDDLAMQWVTNNVNYAVCQIVKVASLFLGCKFFRIIYSRLFNSITLSLAYRNRSNVFTVATIFSLCFLIFSEIPAIVACWSLVYNKTLKDQAFYTSIQGLVVTVIAIIFTLIDIYKAEDYFEESAFWKMKKYVEKVKDFSSMNKLEEGFQVSHEEGSVDAERFVSTSGGKFVYTKQRPEDIKDDFYFEDNQGVSQATDAFDNRPGKKKGKIINIFAPIAEEEGEYYENEKYGEGEIKTEAQLQKARRKLKSIGSDQQQQLTDTIERKLELGISPEQDFSDTKSLLNQRQIKGKWNNIINKRIELSQKIFNRHPPNLAQIDQPLDQNQNEDGHEDSSANIIRHLNYGDPNYKEGQQNEMMGTESQINTNKKRKKKRKFRNNKELEGIYLQRLTDKKQKSGKDLFTSDKSFKYDF